MSTATIAANGSNVRPLAAIKADYAARLAQQPQSIIADVKSALVWAPKKVQRATLAAMRWLHVPQFLAFAQRNTARFLSVVGKGAFAVEVLTSHWGQKTIVKTLQVTASVTNWTVKTAWKIVTSPLRWFTPTRQVVESVDTRVAALNARLTPNSGQTFGPLQITRDLVGAAVSADRSYVKVARTTASAVMAVRITRRFIPVGWLRVLAYIVDGIMIARAYSDDLENTWVGKKLARQAAVIEGDLARQGETVIAEATHMTREAAGNAAQKLRQEADEILATGEVVAQQAKTDIITATHDQAEDLRSQASAMEATAERLAAAETAVAVVEADQEIIVPDAPKPGPGVPPSMGGRAPSTGPVPSGRPQHGSRPKGKR